MFRSVKRVGRVLWTAKQVQLRPVLGLRTFTVKKDDEPLQQQVEEDVAPAKEIKEVEAVASAAAEEVVQDPVEAESIVEEVESAAKDVEQEFEKAVERRRNRDDTAAGDYLARTRLEEQRAHLHAAAAVAPKAHKLSTVDVKAHQAQVLAEIEAEQAAYLDSLDKEEALIKSSQERRVFTGIANKVVDQTKTQLAAHVKALSGKKAKPNIGELQARRKEILIKQAALTPKLGLQKIFDKIKDQQFGALAEKEQRAIYEAVKTGMAREEARIILAEESATVEDAERTLKLYSGILKTIMPDNLKGEFTSLEEIAEKRADAAKMFETMKSDLAAKAEQIKNVQDKLKATDLAAYDATKAAAASQSLQKSKLLPSDQFQAVSHKMVDLQKAIQELEVTAPEDPIAKLTAISHEERDAQQKINLLNLLLNFKGDLQSKMKPLQAASATRGPEEAITAQGMPSSKARREELSQLLKRYNVDAAWLRKQQTKGLQDYYRKQEEALTAKARELEQSMLAREKFSSLDLMKAQPAQLRKRMVLALHAAGSNDPVDKAVLAALESQLADKKFDTTEYLASRLNDKVTVKPAEGTDLTFQQYKINQLVALRLNEQEKPAPQSQATFDVYGNPTFVQAQPETSAFEELSPLKQRAWFAIYNDFLAQFRDRGSDLLKGLGTREVQVQNAQLYAEVETFADFSELFRHWRLRGYCEIIPQSQAPNLHALYDHLQKKLLAQRHVADLGEAAMQRFGVGKPPSIASVQQELRRHRMKGKASIYEHTKEEREPTLGDLERELLDTEKVNMIEAKAAIDSIGKQLDEIRDQAFKRSGAIHILDRNLEAAEAQEVEHLYSELAYLSGQFEADYGIKASDFNPAPPPQAKLAHNEVPDPNPQLHARDHSLADRRISEAYLEQFDDPTFVKMEENLPALKLSDEVVEEIAQQRYHDDLQARYSELYRAENKEILPPEQQAELHRRKQSALQKAAQYGRQLRETSFTTEFGVLRRANASEMDSSLVNAVLRHLNEKGEQELGISSSFAAVPEAEPFDVKGFQAWKDQQRFNMLSDYEKQREILFQAKSKQVQIEKALDQRNEELLAVQKFDARGRQAKAAAGREAEAQRQRARRVQELLTPREERRRYAEESANIRRELKRKQAAIRAAWAKEDSDSATVWGTKDGMRLPVHRFEFGEGFLTEESKQWLDDSKLKEIEDKMIERMFPLARDENEAQAIVLEQDKLQERDPMSELALDGQREAAELFRLGSTTVKQLQEFISTDKFGLYAQVMAQRTDTKQKNSGLLDAAGRLLPEGLKMEEEIMAANALQYRPFDLGDFKQAMVNRSKLYLGPMIGEQFDKVAAANVALSSSEILEAAQTQTMSPEDAKLALLYDPASPAREKELRARYQVFVNRQLRQDLAKKILDARVQYKLLEEKQSGFESQVRNEVSNYCSDVLPKPVFDFFAGDKQGKDSKLQVDDLVKRLANFDPDSREVANYNDELRLQYLIATEQGRDAAVTTQVQYIVQQMAANKVNPDALTTSLLFQLNSQLGNQEEAAACLSKVVKVQNSSQYVNIDIGQLKNFFEASLKAEDFQGLANLIAYCEQNSVDIGQWPMRDFRQSLDYSLNVAPNIMNVLTFARYYLHAARSRLSAPNIPADLSGKDAGVLKELHEQVFGELSGLVDVGQLFGHLVDKLGFQDYKDPVTRKDTLSGLIDFFMREDVRSLNSAGEGATALNEADVAAYYANRIQQPHAARKLLRHAAASQPLAKQAVAILGKNNRLPDADIVRHEYVEARANGLSPAAAELYLSLFSMLDIKAEAIDLCQNFTDIVTAPAEEIRQHYFAKILLTMPTDGHYHNLIEQAVLEGTEATDLSHISAMTKAYIKDGNADFALKFYDEKIKARAETAEKQRVLLCGLYDVLAKTKDVAALESVLGQVNREVTLVKWLKSVVESCEDEQLDNFFSLLTVLREQRQLQEAIDQNEIALKTAKVEAGFNPNQVEAIEQVSQKKEFKKQISKAAEAKKQNEELSQRLAALKERKSVLEDGLEIDERMLNQVLDTKIEMLADVEDVKAVEDIVGHGNKLLGIDGKEENEIMRQFKNKIKDMTEDRLDRYNQGQANEFFSDGLDGYAAYGQSTAEQYEIEAGLNPGQVNTALRRARNSRSGRVGPAAMRVLEGYKEWLYNRDPSKDKDNQLLRGVVKQAADEMADDLEVVLDSRKGAVLPWAIDRFNKIQGLTLKSSNVERVATIDREGLEMTKELKDKLKGAEFEALRARTIEDRLQVKAQSKQRSGKLVDPTKIAETMKQIRHQLEDPSSPVLSALLNGADSEEMTHTLAEARTLSTMSQELDMLAGSMEEMTDLLSAKENELLEKAEELVKSRAYKIQQQQQAEAEGKQTTLEVMLTSLDEDVAPEEKVRLMRSLLNVIGGFQPYQAMSEFHAADMVVFGLKENSHEAIQLGERMLAEADAKMPAHLVKSVKEWKLKHGAARRFGDSGPKSSISVYKQVGRNPAKDAYNRSDVVNADDPYWQEVYDRNFRQADRYMLPSAYAWDHQEGGILGEAVDIKELAKKRAMLEKYL